jgi:hypothetical protein
MRFEPTTIGALLKLVPRSQLAAVVKAHRGDHGVRQLSTWGQLVALLVAQLGGYGSLRELEAVLGSQGGAHYHLGIGRVCRSTLAVANARRPAALFEEMFRLVLGRLGGRVPPAVGREAIRLVDSTTIRLPEMLYGWARRTATHAAVKLHLVYDPTAALPVYFTLTHCRINDIVEAERLRPEPGATYVMDRGYYDFAFWASLDSAGCRFVTRLKSHSPIRLIEARPVSGQDILTDRVVNLSERLGSQRQNPYRQPLREILVRRDDGATLRLVTNDFSRPAEVIAELYKTRWQIELFFKWIKQNLRIRKFLGRSENAVRLQVIAGLIAYLLIHYTHRLAHGSTSRLRFSQLLRANLWQRRPLSELAGQKTERPPDIPQLTFNLTTAPA